VNVLYLGMLREVSGCEREVVALEEGAQLGDLYLLLEQRFPRLRDLRSSLAMAVNFEYAVPTCRLEDQDEVALLPPVSGGAMKPKEEDSTAETPLPLISEHASLVREPISRAVIAASLRKPEDGAMTIFDGIVRNHSRGRATVHLDYTAYEPMALRQMESLAREALANFEIRDVRIVHRLGRLQIGETSVYIVVASAHRTAAFDACRWLIDTLKKTVPIWKREYFADGAVWADGEPFPPDVSRAGESASK